MQFYISLCFAGAGAGAGRKLTWLVGWVFSRKVWLSDLISLERGSYAIRRSIKVVLRGEMKSLRDQDERVAYLDGRRRRSDI